MELPLKEFGIVFQFQKTEHVKNVFKKATGLDSFGACIEILGCQKGDPHEFSINQGQGKGEEKNHQFIDFKPENLERF
jgi:hypothetical protein